MAKHAGPAALLCSERFGSRAARSCCAAADGSLQWEAWGSCWGSFSGAFAMKPEGRDWGGGGPPGAASPLLSRLLMVFLPQGFPESVSPDYLSYQLWDSVQVSGATRATCSRFTDWGQAQCGAVPRPRPHTRESSK